MKAEEGSKVLRQAKEGSEEALNELFRQVGPRLLALIRLRMGPDLRRQLESQDVLQVTLLRAFSRLGQFEGEESASLFGWLGTIARNEIHDQLDYQHRQRRDRHRNVPIEERAGELEARVRHEVSRIHLREREMQLEEAIENLSDTHREVILLRKFEELSYKEIAGRLEKSPDACRMLLARAMAALTRQMAQAP